MAAEENKATIRRLVEEGWNKADANAAISTNAPNFTNHTAAPGTASDTEGARQATLMYMRAFPCLQIVHCGWVLLFHDLNVQAAPPH